MQSTFEGVLLRRLRDGIRIHNRARNVLISHCHIFDNSGRGIFLDRVNLHQVIVTGCHISYCKRGGIKVVGSQIRNLQVTGNDIEYNFDEGAKVSADIWIDSSDGSATVREGTIVGNTIQALFSPGGANVRMVGHPSVNSKAGSFTISNNLIGTQENNIHLVNCRGVVLNGNVVYGGRNRNLLVEGSRNVVVSGNSFDHNPDYHPEELCTGIRVVDTEAFNMSGTDIQDAQEGDGTAGREALVEIERCRRVTLTGCQIVNGTPCGILIRGSSDVVVTGCSVLETREAKAMDVALRWEGEGTGNLLANNRIGVGRVDGIQLDEASGVAVTGNSIG